MSTETRPPIMKLPPELHDSIFDLHRRALVNVNKYFHGRYSPLLHRDFGLIDIPSLSLARILSRDHSMSMDHFIKYAHESPILLINYEHSTFFNQDQLKKVLESFGNKTPRLRHYVGFTNISTLAKVGYECYQKLLLAIYLPNHTVLPRALEEEAPNLQYAKSIWGVVVGLLSEGEYRVSQLKYVYIRPGSNIRTANALRQKHSAVTGEAVLFWSDPRDDDCNIFDLYSSLSLHSC
ncbi:hypothetical protein BU23DRAFT_632076 [Bimuria novae-zelandiae CBS 107.79]|uniref:Uncharacterized protein n=1 Tax=Bimuria novae-zelandiae CBS 107.79 TaxID=1447943 RepID=A0A6A5UKK1_9PLEO|nr:hypothetical protein BU23DRAFT_632076 [Bimuria novae-zelandiae CBS 107.79]